MTMTKMLLKVTVVTFSTPQLEKISRLTASPFYYRIHTSKDPHYPSEICNKTSSFSLNKML